MSDYLIAHIGHTSRNHEHITWWKPDSRGYTICINKAGRYSESEAKKICTHSSCIAVNVVSVEPLAKTTPYYRRSDGSLNKLYDGGPHRPVPNKATEWRILLNSRLVLGGVIKPTRITESKSRAIYVDDLISEATQ
jgi:hypothetical protein